MARSSLPMGPGWFIFFRSLLPGGPDKGKDKTLADQLAEQKEIDRYNDDVLAIVLSLYYSGVFE